jgi:hypothetical protein
MEVLVTGLGLHSAFGDLQESFQAISEDRTALTVQQLRGVDGLPEFLGAQAKPYSLAGLLKDRKLTKYMSETSSLAVLAAGRALENARLLDDRRRLKDTALMVATGQIAFDLSQVTNAMECCQKDDGQNVDQLDYEIMGTKGLRMCHPLMPFKMLLNMPLGLVSIAYGIQGENAIFYPGADQGAMALEFAFRGISAGRFERALVGASVKGLGLVPVLHLWRKKLLAFGPEELSQAYAPADLAAFMVLESSTSAKSRGIDGLAKIDHVGLHTQEKNQHQTWTTGGLGGSKQEHSLDARWGYAQAASYLGLVAMQAASLSGGYWPLPAGGTFERNTIGGLHPHPPRSDRHEYPSPAPKGTGAEKSVKRGAVPYGAAGGRGVIRNKLNVRGEGGGGSTDRPPVSLTACCTAPGECRISTRLNSIGGET